MDAFGNGYCLPNSRGLHVTRSRQQSRSEDGRRETAGDYAAAWLSHGTAPTDAAYEYVLLVDATPEAVARFAAEPEYRILRRDTGAHIVRHAGLGLTGYALFEAQGDIAAGPVRGVDPEMSVFLMPYLSASQPRGMVTRVLATPPRLET